MRVQQESHQRPSKPARVASGRGASKSLGTVSLPFSRPNLIRRFAPALDPARVRRVGLLIGARQAGPFALDIKRIGLV